MERIQFERLKTQLAVASAGQILELDDVIQRLAARQFTAMALARRTRQTRRARTCPHCRGNTTVLHGKDQNGRQRFKCRDCRRTYNIMTGTPMARARKPEKWVTYLGCMSEHMSVRKIVASGIGVHQVTAWRWRQRFLQASVNDNAPVLTGVVEAGETVFARSFKGSRGCRGATKRRRPHEPVPVLAAMDSGSGVFEAILTPLTGIEVALQGRIAAGSVLCSDGNTAYLRVAATAGAEHYGVSVSPAVNSVPTWIPTSGRLGLGRVKHHHHRLRHLINERCRGVATKYLDRYLGWHRAMIRPGFEGKMLLGRALA
jgi:transposase-like protein